MLFSCYRDACYHVIKGVNDDGVRLKAGSVPAANKAEDAASHLQRGVVLSMKDCMGNHMACPRPSVNKRRSTWNFFVPWKTSYTILCSVSPFLVMVCSTLVALLHHMTQFCYL